MNTVNKIEIHTKWTELKDALKNLSKYIVEAGQVVAWILDNDPEAREKFRKAGLTPAFYGKLEKVGRGTLLPELFDYPSFGRLPIDQQRKVLTGDVIEMVRQPDGSYDSKKVDLLRASPEVVNRVVGGKELRTPEEQRRMIEKTKVVKAEKPVEMPWHIAKNGREFAIEFVRPCVMSRSDLVSALRALEV
jgi:hypothetical protein